MALPNVPAHSSEDPARAAASSNPVKTKDETLREPKDESQHETHESNDENQHETEGVNQRDNEDTGSSSSSSSSSALDSSKRRKIKSAISKMEQMAEIFGEIDDWQTCHGLIEDAIASL